MVQLWGRLEDRLPQCKLQWGRRAVLSWKGPVNWLVEFLRLLPTVLCHSPQWAFPKDPSFPGREERK